MNALRAIGALEALLVIVLSFGCENLAPPVPISSMGRPNGFDQKAQPVVVRNENGEIVTIQVPERPRVTVADLHSSAMRLNGFAVGKAESFRADFPLVRYFIPNLADYVQIVRCPANIRLQGLEDVDIGNPSSSVAQRIFETTDFWSKAAGNPLCRLLSESVSNTNYIDFFAPNGNWIYIGRACVVDSRKPGDTTATVDNCTRQVMVTQPHTGYVNQVYERNKALEADYRRIRDEADTLGHRVYEITVELNNALRFCLERDARQAAGQQRKNAMLTIMNTGIGIGARMFAPSHMAEANLLSSAIHDLFVSASDFPRSCTEAERLRTEGEVTAQRLQDLKTLYDGILNKVTGEQQQGATE